MTAPDSTLAALFPETDPGQRPAGFRVLVQLRKALDRTSGGIILPDESRDADQMKTVVARVVAVGPGAFISRATGNSWPGAPYCEVGEYVRVPKFGGDRFEHHGVTFVYFNDEDIIAVVTDPAAV